MLFNKNAVVHCLFVLVYLLMLTDAAFDFEDINHLELTMNKLLQYLLSLANDN